MKTWPQKFYLEAYIDFNEQLCDSEQQNTV